MVDSEARLEFHLARMLGMTVYDLRQRMTADEFMSWSAFLEAESTFIEVM